jgi:hypothetical protein
MMECAITALVVSGTRVDDEVPPLSSNRHACNSSPLRGSNPSHSTSPVSFTPRRCRCLPPCPHPYPHNPSSPCAPPPTTPPPRKRAPSTRHRSSQAEESRYMPSDSDQSLLAFLLQYLRQTTVSGAQLEVVFYKRVSLKLENHADVSLLMSEPPAVPKAPSATCYLQISENIYSYFSYVNSPAELEYVTLLFPNLPCLCLDSAAPPAAFQVFSLLCWELRLSSTTTLVLPLCSWPQATSGHAVLKFPYTTAD